MVRHQNRYLLRLLYFKVLSLVHFLIYINGRSDDLVSTVKLFADYTFLISAVYDINVSPNELNH